MPRLTITVTDEQAALLEEKTGDDGEYESKSEAVRTFIQEYERLSERVADLEAEYEERIADLEQENCPLPRWMGGRTRIRSLSVGAVNSKHVKSGKTTISPHCSLPHRIVVDTGFARSLISPEGEVAPKSAL